ncbi:hypothetical protein PAMP_006731 [Pampus punctatissimus]
MRRQENQPPRPTAGCLSVPLFNQKKRNRIPLTSAPSENEFFSQTEYTANTSSATSHSTSGIYGCYQASGSSFDASQSHQWSRQVIPQSTQRQQYGSRPAPGPAPTTRAYTPTPHPYKAGSTSSTMGQTNIPVRQQDSSSTVNFKQNKYQTPHSSESAQSKQTPHTGFSQMSRQSSNKLPATLDSAVTLGHHGAKNFLMRDGKEVVQCVFYENEQELPRLIRGQVHRCVGNYDRSRDVLVCVSVRPGLPSELRNAQESVKACDAEMRALVKSLSEV